MQERYSHGYDDSVLNSYRSRSAANSAAYLLPHLQADMRLLDVGCGPGSISADFADVLAQGQVNAVDVSPESIAAAQAMYARDNLQFETASAYALPFADASFDVVHAHQVLQHLADPERALREMVRVLKPNGILAVRDTAYNSMTWQPATPALQQWLDVYQAIATHSGGNPNIGPELQRLCEAVGFTDIVTSTSPWHYHAANGSAQWWGEMWSVRVLKSDFSKLAQEQGLLTDASLQQLSHGWQTWATLPNAEFTMTHHQILARKA